LKAHAGKVRIAVVSGGSRATISKTLRLLGISKLVEVLVCAGETLRGKPHPDPFLYAAEQFGVEPSKCLVFEDGDPGVRAAEAAGMRWIRIDHV
jgi:HAD superfamily hydrolase (TIGR01509 family)